MNVFTKLMEEAKYRLRGEKRVSPGLRGRVFQKKNEPEGDKLSAKAIPKASIKVNFITDGQTGKKYTQEEWAARTDRN